MSVHRTTPLASSRPARGAGSPSGFTIIELLVVITIIAALLGLVSFNFARSDTRREAVRGAADELAATMRRARALAMERKATFAVVFHIQNDPASSGRVLNNRTGGHWYRILGPTPNNDGLPTVTSPPYAPYNVVEAAAGTADSWCEEAHVLPARQVRFLALADMDYGDYPPAFPYGNAGRSASATRSFPRPWFGWYDRAAGRLYPWGGYDPAVPASGFYYWGNPTKSTTGNPVAWSSPRDPQPLGCTNAVERRLDHWTSWNGQDSTYSPPNNPGADLLYDAGSPRPLLCAAWRDVSMVFTASGEVRWGNFLAMRHCRLFSDAVGVAARRGIAERCNGQSDWSAPAEGAVNQHTQTEAGNFDAASGGWFITLAPDTLDDRDTFGSAEEALKSITPMYRVFVSAFGDIRVIAVSRKPDFSGLSPFPGDEAWWRTGTNTIRYFGRDRLVDGSVLASDGKTGLGANQGRPITDFLTAGMLINRQVWMR